VARLIDPAIARVVARRVAGNSAVADSYLMERLERDLDEAVPFAEARVAETSGIPAPPPVPWGLVDRAGWANANIAGMARMLAPLADKVATRMEGVPGPIKIAQRVLLSTEVGVLLGYVSRRVLGQYDVLVTESPERSLPRAAPSGAPAKGTVLYFVGPNIIETERRYGFVPRDFSLWVAVHEVTHRFQFAGVPWLQEKFFELVGRYFESVDLDASSLAKRVGEAVKKLASRSLPPEERNPVYLFAGENQRRLLDEIQALMAVVEGHGNYVMDNVGAEVIPSFRRMRRVFEARRKQTTLVQKIFNTALGIEMKLRQYELGQSFCEAVVSAEGPAALERLWVAPEMLPSLQELRDPNLWLRRVA
jgi:coenzyme F420 biosynthesis associated uncharacterized protein